MNLLFSLRRTKFSAILLFLSLSIFLASCKPEPDPETLLPQRIEELSTDSPLIGKWKDSYENCNTYDDVYDTQISTSFIETASYGKHESKIYIGKIDDNSGYIYYQLSENRTGYNDSASLIQLNAKENGLLLHIPI